MNHCIKTLKFLFLTVLLQACNTADINPDSSENTSITDDTSSESHMLHEAANDFVWDAVSEVSISLKGSSASIVGTGASSSGSIVTISSAGNYRISGSLTNGQIYVNSKETGIVRIILSGADIQNTSGAAIHIKNAEKAVLILADNTQNKLTDGSTYTFEDATEEEPDATLFSNEDLSIGGNGSLVVNANFRDAIASKDGLIIKNGNITVNAADDGIRGKDYLLIHDGTFNITAKADALKASEDEDTSLGYLTINKGAFSIAAGDDGIHAESTLTINDGTINISKSYEGLEAKIININGGKVDLLASDDGVNAADGTDPRPGSATTGIQLNINGGYLMVNAAGDGLDCNGNVAMTGGTALVHGPTANMNAPLDYDGSFKISGGTLLAVGSSGMAQMPGTSSTQNSLMLTLSNQAAGTLVRLQTNNGSEIFTFKPLKSYQSVVYSSANLGNGSYDLYLSGSTTGTSTGGLISSGATYTNGTKSSSISISSINTKVTSR